METLQVLTDFYSGYDEDGRLLSRHGSVEYLTTMRYIEKYLAPGVRILEIGAATGRYSHALAQQGYRVDAVELVQHNIDIFRRNTQPGEKITIRQGNAKDLSFFVDDLFDITLLLGPMYHLFTVQEQKQALSEAIRVTKPGGIIFAAYCGNEATMIQYCFGRGMLKEQKYRDLVDPVTFGCSRDALWYALRRQGIEARRYFRPALADASCYRAQYGQAALPVARHAARTLLCLPLFDSMSFDQVDRVCGAVLSVCNA